MALHAVKGIHAIDFIDEVTRVANKRVQAQLTESFGPMASYPTVTPGQVRVVIDVYREILAAWEAKEQE